jgi:hypothetical protein
MGVWKFEFAFLYLVITAKSTFHVQNVIINIGPALVIVVTDSKTNHKQ